MDGTEQCSRCEVRPVDPRRTPLCKYCGPYPDPFTMHPAALRRAQCVHPHITTVRIVKSNGLQEARDRCADCGDWWGGVKLSDLNVPIESVPLWRDRRTDDHPCERCGDPATESHHWAPVAIFGWDIANSYPQSWLCRDCHTTWHTTMNRSRK